MQTTTNIWLLIGLAVAVGAVAAAYYYGHSIGFAAGRDEGFGDGKREGSREGSMRGYAVGFDRGRRRDATGGSEGDTRNRLGLGFVGCILAAIALFMMSQQATEYDQLGSEPSLTPSPEIIDPARPIFDEPSIDQ